MISLVILSSILLAIGLSTGMAIALGRAGAHADESLDHLLHQRRLAPPMAALRQSYAGLAHAQSAIALEPSTTMPSSRSVGGRRLPVSSFTSRRPRVRLNTPSSRPKS